MRSITLDREERCVRIEPVRRNGNVLFRGNGEYAMRGVSWAWGRPAYPRHIFALQFIPFIGPFIARYVFLSQTNVFIAPGIMSVLEPRFNALDSPMTDEQALSVMEAHAEAMSLGRKQFPVAMVVAVVAAIVGFLAVASFLL